MSAALQFHLLKPTSAADAINLRVRHPDSRYLAGGTDLLPNLRHGLVKSEILIDLGGVAELNDLREEAGCLRIGAGVTLSTLASHPLVATRLPALAQAAGMVAGPTHRAAATLGGNLCLDTRCQYYNQSEAWRRANHYCLKLDGDTCRVAKKSPRCLAAFSGDVAPALIALGATVELAGPQGVRRLPIGEFYVEDGKVWLAIGADELLTAVHVPLATGWISAYEKIRLRGSIDFPLAGIAVALARRNGALSGLHIASTGLASCPLAVEGLDTLVGQALDAAALEKIGSQVDLANRAMKTTVVDVLYRRGVASVLAQRLVQRLWDDPAWTA